jgi:threonine dehydratase
VNRHLCTLQVASGGSHGVAVAYAARQLSVRAKIFVATVASPAKIERIRQYGADLVIEGERYADALAASQAWMTSTGALAVHAYDQLETLLGQGTIGRELAAQAPAIHTLLVPVGGGGLIGGIAAWYAGSVRTIGVEPEAAPTLTAALKAGQPVDAEAGGVAAESLAPRRVGELMLPIAQAYVDRVVLVTDAEIRRAQAALWASLRIVAEPGGAAALAPLLSGRYYFVLRDAGAKLVFCERERRTLVPPGIPVADFDAKGEAGFEALLSPGESSLCGNA